MKKALSLLMLSLIAVSLLNSLGQIPINMTPPSDDSEHKTNAPTSTLNPTSEQTLTFHVNEDMPLYEASVTISYPGT